MKPNKPSSDISTGTRGETVGEALRRQGVSRRGFLKFCATTASLMALPPSMIPRIAKALETARRPSVIWLSFQECTGCTESLTRSHAPTVEGLIFDAISLDYHHTLQAAAGEGAEAAREEAMKENHGAYILVVDGSIPLGNPGYSTIAGISNLEMLKEAAEGAAAIIAVGSCAAFGGIPHANPNPTGAVSVQDIITDKPVVNVPGCPGDGTVAVTDPCCPPWNSDMLEKMMVYQGSGGIGAAVGGAAGAGIGSMMDQQEAEYRQALAASQAASIRREGELLAITLRGDVFFDVDSSLVRPGLYREIERIAQVMARYPSMTIMVEGFTDSTGDESYNLELSQRRADAVRDLLVTEGVNPTQIRALGFGEGRPIASNATREGRQFNRRVEIRIQPS